MFDRAQISQKAYPSKSTVYTPRLHDSFYLCILFKKSEYKKETLSIVTV